MRAVCMRARCDIPHPLHPGPAVLCHAAPSCVMAVSYSRKYQHRPVANGTWFGFNMLFSLSSSFCNSLSLVFTFEHGDIVEISSQTLDETHEIRGF